MRKPRAYNMRVVRTRRANSRFVRLPSVALRTEWNRKKITLKPALPTPFSRVL